MLMMEVSIGHDMNITTFGKGPAKCGASKACRTALDEDLSTFPWCQERREC